MPLEASIVNPPVVHHAVVVTQDVTPNKIIDGSGDIEPSNKSIEICEVDNAKLTMISEIIKAPEEIQSNSKFWMQLNFWKLFPFLSLYFL